MNATTVGQSPDRTPGKHALLNQLLGREVGAYQHSFLRHHPRYHIDLCAGDGHPTDSSHTSSPTIFQDHTTYLRQKMVRVDLVLIEKAANTFGALQANTQPHPHTTLVHGDSRDPGVVPRFPANPNTSVFIHNDPNSIHHFALTPELVDRLPKHTTVLCTLGCNVGSLKRLPEEDRAGWYHHVNTVTGMMAKHHDALLIALNNDASQWAYLITGPTKWQNRYRKDADRAFAKWSKGITYYQYRTQRHQFDDLCDQLFRTKAERQAAS